MDFRLLCVQGLETKVKPTKIILGDKELTRAQEVVKLVVLWEEQFYVHFTTLYLKSQKHDAAQINDF